MDETYMKETNVTEKTEIEKEMELIQNIMKTSNDLKIANSNFNFAQGELVDYYAYQIKANQSKLNYLIKIAKTKGLVVDMINDIKFRLWNEDEEAI